MSTLNCIETYIDKEQNHYGCFIIEPLETGQGITLGNALRRTLLSDLTSFSIVGTRINNLKHEFTTIEGLREDVLEVLLNLKEIIFKDSFKLQKQKNLETIKGFLHVKGPVVITASMLNLPKHLLKIVNPEKYLGTIIDNSEFYLEVDIEKGKGYRLSEEKNRNYFDFNTSSNQPTTLAVDAIFMPVKKVNYKIKLIHDTQGNIKESLSLEIWTNGSISPKCAIQESIKTLMNLFYPLLMNTSFISLTSNANKDLLDVKQLNKLSNT